MIFGSIGTLIDQIKELVVNYLNGIAQQFNDAFDSISKEIGVVSNKLDDVKSAVDANNIGGVSDKLDEVKSAVEANNIDGVSNKLDEIKVAIEANNIGGDIQDLKQKTAQIESGISEGIQGELSNVNQTLDERFNSVDNQLSAVVKNIEQLVGDKARELEKLRGEAAQASVLRSTLTEKENQFVELNKQISDFETNLVKSQKAQDDLREEVAAKQADVDAAKAELETERQNSAATKAALQVWRDSVAYYAPVRDSMNKCEVFQKFLEGRGLLGDSDEVLFAFVQELGKTIDFLRDVHQAALDARKAQGNNPAIMSKEEIAVYESLNSCYRRIWNIDFDVFVTPGERKSLGEGFYKIQFSKDDAVVLKDPRNRSLRFVKDIYVPLLLNREKRMYKQAYVEASNL